MKQKLISFFKSIKLNKKTAVIITAVAMLVAVSALVISLIFADNRKNQMRSFYVALYSENEIYETRYVLENTAITLPENLMKDGYVFMGWYYDENVWKNEFEETVPVAKNITLYAYWLDENSPLNKRITGWLQGGTFDGGGSYREFLLNSEITITATVPEGKKFLYWTLDGEEIQNAANPFSFIGTESFHYTAVFGALYNEYELTVEGGTINGISETTGVFIENESVTITATIPEGKRFICWRQGENVITSNPYVFEITDDMYFEAEFGDVQEEPERGLIYAFDSDSQSYYVEQFVYSNEKSVVIPEEYDNGENGKKPVTKIGRLAFQLCSNIQRIIIPPGITAIEELAFSGCAGLNSIYIPDTVITIGENIFQGCPEVEIYCQQENQQGWTVNWNSGKDSIFWRCPGTGETPDGIQYIKVSESNAAIVGYEGTATVLSLPAVYFGVNMTAVGSGAFDNYSNLISLTIPSSITKIGDNAFKDNKSLLRIFAEGTTVPALGVSAISSEFPALKIYVPQDKVAAYKSAANWSNFSQMIYSRNIINIDNLAINNGRLLQYTGVETTVNVPATVTSIDSLAFFGCGIEAVAVAEENTSFTSFNGVLYNKAGTELIYYPSAKTDLSYTAIETLEKINTMAFIMNGDIESVDLLDIAEIGDYAFNGCDNITSVYFRSSPPAIGSEVFTAGSKLTFYVPEEFYDAFRELLGVNANIVSQ